MHYAVPTPPATAVIEIIKSRFIAYSFPVQNRTAALAHLAEVKAQHPDARHHCWAYQIGAPQQATAAMDDDGEPGGTAGKPILSRIQHSGLSDVMVIVVRYFGGIKLGAGGLIHAYGQAAGEVLSQTPSKPYLAVTELILTLPFEQEHALRQWLSLHQGQWLQSDYTSAGVQVRIRLPVHLLNTFKTHFPNISPA